MHLTPIAAGRTTLPAPPMPARIGEIIGILNIIVEYGQHLLDTIHQRAAWRSFATIAQFFGGTSDTVILPHICRGLMRAVALRRILLARAARNRDLKFPAPRPAVVRAQAAPGPKPAPALSREHQPLTLETLPSEEEITAEVRRRSIGRNIVDICRDLGISPSLCEGRFWNRIFDAILSYRGSMASMLKEMRRRETAVENLPLAKVDLDWPEHSRHGIRRVLGFFIGEPPVDPCPARPNAPASLGAPAVATGPP